MGRRERGAAAGIEKGGTLPHPLFRIEMYVSDQLIPRLML